jgi:hypothetical protein
MSLLQDGGCLHCNITNQQTNNHRSTQNAHEKINEEQYSIQQANNVASVLTTTCQAMMVDDTVLVEVVEEQVRAAIYIYNNR